MNRKNETDVWLPGEEKKYRRRHKIYFTILCIVIAAVVLAVTIYLTHLGWKYLLEPNYAK